MKQAKPTRTHALVRTSPKGGPFIGTCTLCGLTGIALADQFKTECVNVRGLTSDQALIEILNPRNKAN